MTTDLASPRAEASTRTARLRRVAGHPLARLVAVLTCALALSTWFLVPRIQATPGISPQDELSYIDTLVRVQDGQLLMRQGSTLDDETLQELGCRGVDQSALIPDKEICAGTEDSDVVFYNTADIDPPAYHWTVALLAQVPFDLGFTRNMITAARLLGVVWCALAMTAIFFLARRLGAPVVAAACASVTVLWLSITNIQFQYVTPHSTGVLVGAVVALVVTARLQDRVGWWLVSLAGLLAGTVKLTNLVIVMAGAVAFLVAFAWPRAAGTTSTTPGDETSAGAEPVRRPRRRLWDAVNLGGAAMLATVAWVVVRRLLRTSDVEPYAWAVVDRLSWTQILENVASFVFPWSTGALRGFALLLAVAAFGTAAWFVVTRGAPVLQRQLAAGLLASAVLAPVALVVMNWTVTRYYVPTQGRYGLSLLPLAVALAATRVQHRAAQVALVVVSVICLALAWDQAPSLVGS